MVPALAAAQDRPTLSGTWSASALSESWSFTDWGEACGAKPAARGAGGGSVQIREQGGELSIVGAGRAWSTAECWEQMPGLARVSHSASGGGRFWRTRCSTPQSDPRRATVTTSTSATDSSITMTETGQYTAVIKDGVTCSASVTRSRSYSLVRREGEEPPPAASASASATPAAPPASATPAASARPPRTTPKVCTDPGEPARLEVYPARKVLRPGEKFAFRAVVVDSEGCAVNVKPTWVISAGPLAGKATVEGGTVQIAEDAGEGRLEVVASVAGKGVQVVVEVASDAHYDELLTASNAAGDAEGGAIAVIATGAVGGRKGVAEDVARERKQIFVAIVGGIAACLGFAGLLLARRGRRRATPAEEGEEALSEETGATTEEADEIVVPAPETAAAPASSPPNAAPSSAQKPPRKGKVCPTCGSRYDAEALFCGADGTSLVPLN
jgi:hypothetical protein